MAYLRQRPEESADFARVRASLAALARKADARLETGSGA